MQRRAFQRQLLLVRKDLLARHQRFAALRVLEARLDHAVRRHVAVPAEGYHVGRRRDAVVEDEQTARNHQRTILALSLAGLQQ
ncbi:hypothetical protein D3C87_1760310 [compost metagenome]